MAKNDMMLLIYKILRYLYDSNKAGKSTGFEDLFNATGLIRIPYSYAAQILKELVDNRYITGCFFTETKDGTLITLGSKATITIKGVEYLDSNSYMKMAKEFCGETFEVLLSSIISAVI